LEYVIFVILSSVELNFLSDVSGKLLLLRLQESSSPKQISLLRCWTLEDGMDRLSRNYHSTLGKIPKRYGSSSRSGRNLGHLTCHTIIDKE
jgi:hypothetical protein